MPEYAGKMSLDMFALARIGYSLPASGKPSRAIARLLWQYVLPSYFGNTWYCGVRIPVDSYS